MRRYRGGKRTRMQWFIVPGIVCCVMQSQTSCAQKAADDLNRLDLAGDYTFSFGIEERFANTPQQMSRDGYTREILKDSVDLYVKQKKMTQEQADEQIKNFKPLPPTPVPKRKYITTISSKGEKFYWGFSEGANRQCFLFDGRKSYFYSATNKILMADDGFVTGPTVDIPAVGRNLPPLPLFKEMRTTVQPHLYLGEVSVGSVNSQGKAAYLPGNIVVATPHNDMQVVTAEAFDNTKPSVRWAFKNYRAVGAISVPTAIRKTLYDPSSDSKTPQVYATLDYKMTDASLRALPDEEFDVVALLDREAENNARVTVEWRSGKKQMTFLYKKGTSLESQAEAEQSKQTRTVLPSEEGKTKPRAFMALGLLAVLLVAGGWKGIAVVKAGR